jgi:hypothetical protein
VQNVGLTWQQAAAVTAGLAVVGLAVHRLAPGRWREAVPALREAALLCGLYSLWQLAGSLSVLGTSGAYSRARWLESAERFLHLPSEAGVQGSITGHPLVVQAANLYYATMHFGVLFAFLLWLFFRHRDAYRSIRLTLVLLTATCLIVQLVPVAPPRLLPGYVDTAAQYGQSVYALGISADQLSAMPSVHVGWAVLIAWAVIKVSPSPWRWWIVLHPILTTWFVVATANHFWLDGVVAIALLVLCAQGQALTRTARARHRSAGLPRTAVDVLPAARPDVLLGRDRA